MRKAPVEKAAHCVKAMAHPLRLGLLTLLAEGEKNVQELTKTLGTTQSNVSQHLAQMRLRGLVTARREENRTYYRVTDPRVLKLVKLMQEVFCGG